MYKNRHRVRVDKHVPNVSSAQTRIQELQSGNAEEAGRLTRVTRERSAYDVCNNEAKKVDTELVNDWRESLNAMLLFAAIFAGVLTPFIIESMKMLQQDQISTMVNVMVFMTSNLANETNRPYVEQEFQASPSAIIINSLLFASLSTSLVAALASVVALQWVADYDAAITRGGSSPKDRAKRRQFWFAGVVKWRMGEIIATIPLFIYCSVLLFFSGLILWMSPLHSVVCAVVAAGAAVAFLFWAGTTFLAVFFVSAPFRTPISRGIHSLAHISFSFQYLLARSLGIRRLIPEWLREHRHLDTRSNRREDRQVERESELESKALVWLANQLSISQDSSERLVLLASELPSLPAGYFQYSNFTAAPWFSIFDLLGWELLKKGPNEDVSAKDMRACEVLIQCSRIPKIRELVGLTRSTNYITEETDKRYWSQHCTIPSGPWTQPSRSGSPNSLFLLLRDITLPSKADPGTLEAIIRLSRWRNSPDKVPEAWVRILDHEIALAISLDGSVTMLGRFLRASTIDGDFQSRYVPVMERMIHILINGDTTISPAALNLLRRGFECLLDGGSDRLETSCLSMPINYRDGLRKHVSLRSLHYSFTLLLARGLYPFSGTDRIRRVKEVITMLWAAPVFHGRLEETAMTPTRGVEKFFDANKEALMVWIKNAAQIPYINEILHHLAAVQIKQPEIGPLWRRALPQAGSDPHIFEVFKEFQDLINRGVTAAQHFTLVDLICRDLEVGPPGIFGDWFTDNDLGDLEGHLRDPCLHILAKSVTGSNIEPLAVPFMGVDDSRKESWARIAIYLLKHYEGVNTPSILRTLASMWPFISDQRGICERAMRDPELLTHLRRIFTFPTPCLQHHDHDGHLLLHILNGPTSELGIDLDNLTAVPMKHRRMETLFVLLVYICAGYNEVPPEQQFGDISAQCLAQLWDLGKVTMSSQFSILSLLSNISTTRWVYPEHVAAISICVTTALDLPYDSRVTPILDPLAKRILRIRDLMKSGIRRSEEERDAAALEADNVISRLTSYGETVGKTGG